MTCTDAEKAALSALFPALDKLIAEVEGAFEGIQEDLALTESNVFRFVLQNLFSPKIATGTVTFIGNGYTGCTQNYQTNNTATLTFPVGCHPLVAIEAKVNNNIRCTPYSTNDPPFPLPIFYIVEVKDSNGGVPTCQVCDRPFPCHKTTPTPDTTTIASRMRVRGFINKLKI